MTGERDGKNTGTKAVWTAFVRWVAHDFLNGAWLLILYSVSIWLVLGTVSSYLWQDQIRKDALGLKYEVRLTVAGVVVRARQYEEIKDRIAQVSEKIAGIRANLIKLQDKQKKQIRKYILARRKYNDITYRIETIFVIYGIKFPKIREKLKFQLLQDTLVKLIGEGPDVTNIKGSPEYIEETKKKWDISWPKHNKELAQHLRNLRSRFTDFVRPLSDVNTSRRDINKVREDQKEASNLLKDLICRQERLVGDECPDPSAAKKPSEGGAAGAKTSGKGGAADLSAELAAQSKRLRDYIAEFQTFGEFSIGPFSVGFAFLASMPAQLLTLILTLSMGALGSVIYLTRTYFDKEADEPFSFYLFRTFLGMVTALSIFVLFKAGQISISDRTLAEGSSENLNPFLISFLAILSGLFTEHAYTRIQRAGWAIFRSGAKEAELKDRYGSGLKEAIKGRNLNELAEFAGVDSQTVRDWISEKQKIPPAAQRIAAAWLNKPMRELFTDLPPVKS